MQYASISVSYSGYTSNFPTEEEDGKPSKASLTLSAVEHVIAVAAKALGIPVFHEYSWPDGSCYKVIAAENIRAAVAFLEAAIIEAAPNVTHIGEVEIPSFTINGICGLRELPPDAAHFDWRGDSRTIKEIFDGKPMQVFSPPSVLTNRKQRRAEAAIERDKRIPRDPEECA